MKIKIVYTSDTHGKLSAYDFLNKNYGKFGLSRLPTYLKQLNSPYLLLDNGDYLQGSPLLDYSRKNKLKNPVAKVFNALDYTNTTIGNHDFNYGLSYLESFQSMFKNDILCANIYKEGKPYFKPYAMVDLHGLRIAVIGLITEYTPFWENPKHIKDLKFMDVVETTKTVISTYNLKQNADLIVVLYHGGFNRSFNTGLPYGPLTFENKGYELFQIKEVDILLTGHQHVPQIHQQGNRIAMQTSSNATDFGVVTIDFEHETGKNIITNIEGAIVSLADYEIDIDIENLVKDEIEQTNVFLSETIGFTTHDMSITSALSCRVTKHPLFQLINRIQLEYTKADISAASLPNETHGFFKEVTLNDIAINFPFENDLVVLEITGAMLKEVLEKNAEYFEVDQDEIVISPKYLFPKVEHYNYDVYDGIEYVIDLSRHIGKRITRLMFKGKNVEDGQIFKLALNSYRSLGSGGFDILKKAKRIMSYPISYFELIEAYVRKHPHLDFEIKQNFSVIK